MPFLKEARPKKLSRPTVQSRNIGTDTSGDQPSTVAIPSRKPAVPLPAPARGLSMPFATHIRKDRRSQNLEI